MPVENALILLCGARLDIDVATNGSFQWTWFCWTMLIKLLLYYNFLFNLSDPKTEAEGLIFGLRDNIMFQATIFIIPVGID